jgi:predicted kinase
MIKLANLAKLNLRQQRLNHLEGAQPSGKATFLQKQKLEDYMEYSLEDFSEKDLKNFFKFLKSL